MNTSDKRGEHHRSVRETARRNISDKIDKLADGQWHKYEEMLAAFNASRLSNLSVIPWLSIQWRDGKCILEIDKHLRQICEGDARRPELDNVSIREFLASLRSEITRRRKENHDQALKRTWNPENIAKREQSELLNWIEEELRRIKL